MQSGRDCGRQKGRALQAAAGRRKAEGSARDRPRDHDGSPKIILVGPTFYFFEVNTENYWRWSLFCLRISIWGVRKQQVLEENKLLEMPELLFRYQKISLFGFKS